MLKEYEFADRYLEEGEKVLWQGKPEKGGLLTANDFLMIPFSVIWCGFAIFWTVTAMRSAGFFGFLGLPFTAVGLYLVFGRFIKKSIERKNTAYVITEKKIIRKCGAKRDMLYVKNMPPMYVTMLRNGNITINFGKKKSSYGWGYIGRRGYWGGESEVFELVNISDSEGVRKALEKLR